MADGEGPTRRLDLGAVTEYGAPKEHRSDVTEGDRAQPLKGEGHEGIKL